MIHELATQKQGELEGERGEVEPKEHKLAIVEPERELESQRIGIEHEQQQGEPKLLDDSVECGVSYENILFGNIVHITSKCVSLTPSMRRRQEKDDKNKIP